MNRGERPDEVVPPASSDPDRDLGFGSVVAENRRRLLNRDGSFNVTRSGLSLSASLSPYHALLTMSWGRFLALVAAAYLGLNTLFAFGFLLCGPGAIGGEGDGSHSGFLRAFFFSVQTFATIGYGHIHPVGIAANVLVTVESLVGLMGFALSTGILFSRFSRPTARIVFSRRALIAPYQGITAFEFRIANERSNQLIELEAKVLLSRFESAEGKSVRRFYPLPLERSKVVFFPLSWTIVHPIDEASPLFGVSDRQLIESDAEFLILLTGIDETFSQTVHSRSSYRAEEIVWNARFQNLFVKGSGGDPLSIDIGRLHDFEKAPAREEAPQSVRSRIL